MRKLAVALFVAAVLGTSTAHALGVGDIQLHSRLNQPLNASIELVALRGLSPDDIKVNIASVDEFDRAGIDRPYALHDLRFSVETSGDAAVIRAKTKDAVREPFLNFIVEVNWPNGRMLREYTVLLDPPTYASEAPVVSAPAYVEPETPSLSGVITEQIPEPATQTDEVTEPPVSGEERVVETVSNNAAGVMAGTDVYGPTQSKDTLWSIASRVRPDGATVHQTLVAIFKANPHSFANNNPNQLLTEQTLKIPSADEIKETPHRRALAEFLEQSGTPVLETRSSRRVTETAIPDGRLVVSSTREGSDTGTVDDSTRSREAAEVLNQENENLRRQLDRQSEKAEKLEKLVKLKSEQLATTPAVEASTEPTTVDSSATEVKAVPESTTDTSVATDNAVKESVEAEQVVAEEVPAANPSTRLPEQPEEVSIVDILMDNLIYILAGFGAIALVVGGMIFHRRRVEREKFQETLLPPEKHDLPLDLAEDFDLPEVGDDILSAPEHEETIAGNDVVADPLGEADIYIAYGKFEQAEQLLIKALALTPQRHELRLKLLECYAEMRDSEKFSAQISKIQSAMNADPRLAKQVEELRVRAWPNDEVASGSLPTADDIFGSVGVGVNAPVTESSSSIDSTTSSWHTPAPTPAPSVAEVDFNLDMNNDFGGFESTTPDSVSSPSSSEMSDDFNFDLAEAELAQADWQAPETASYSKSGSSSDEIMLDMDSDDGLPNGDELGMSDIDEIATKLDLARAYIEMHETEGAREILQEVVAEGNAEQKKEAQTLLARI